MKTPIQEFYEYMEGNQYFIGNDLYAKYKELLEKEKDAMGLLLNFILKHYSIDFDASLDGYCFVNEDGDEVFFIGEILEHYYNETFNK